jgi:hypothetical protein
VGYRVLSFECTMYGVEYMVWDTGCGAQGVEYMVWDTWCGIHGVGHRVWNTWCGIQGVGYRAWSVECVSVSITCSFEMSVRNLSTSIVCMAFFSVSAASGDATFCDASTSARHFMISARVISSCRVASWMFFWYTSSISSSILRSDECVCEGQKTGTVLAHVTVGEASEY